MAKAENVGSKAGLVQTLGPPGVTVEDIYLPSQCETGRLLSFWIELPANSFQQE